MTTSCIETDASDLTYSVEAILHLHHDSTTWKQLDGLLERDFHGFSKLKLSR